MTQRLAVDIGGTFVDAVVFDTTEGSLRLEKDFTTPEDPANGVHAAIARSEVPMKQVETFVHGTTLGLNTVLERKGAPTGIITNEGFEDVYEMGRYEREQALMYSLRYRDPELLVRRRFRLGVPGRMTADGQEYTPLDEDAVRRAAEKLINAGVASIAVCFLHAYKNPAHEVRAREIIQDAFPQISVSISSDIIREYREYERTSTTVLNAYIKPTFRTYVQSLEDKLTKDGFKGSFYITRSGGGALLTRDAMDVPVHTVFSGPAGGLIGAAHLSGIIKRDNLITVDMGGTSTDACVIQNGRPALRYESDLERLPLMIPTYEISTIGAGGGSIARAENGRLLVGPQSAGAEPGPACYGRGGDEPTFTDAALALNYLDPQRFLGGQMALDAEAGLSAIQNRLADPLELAVTDVARGVYDVLLAKTVSAIREITVEKGRDPREFSMLSFGGAGGIFVPLVGREMGVKEIIIPQAPSVFSAWGMLMTDIVQEYAQTHVALIEDMGLDAIMKEAKSLETKALEGLKRGGFAKSRQAIEYAVEMRYFGQEHSLEISLDGIKDLAALKDRFDEAHLQRYGHTMNDPVQLVHIRVRGIGKNDKPPLKKIARRKKGQPLKPVDQVNAYCFAKSKPVRFDLYERDDLRAGDEIKGPAIINERTSTHVFHSDQQAGIDAFGQIVITGGGA